uniref:Uncharacterized protein n=1 Tax=Timema douglasi TaxID=61478 RepID=A0A7R8ZFI4_TIMDO|nr:unnamed protein product [Timema douglasi]
MFGAPSCHPRRGLSLRTRR